MRVPVKGRIRIAIDLAGDVRCDRSSQLIDRDSLVAAAGEEIRIAGVVAVIKCEPVPTELGV